jgi:16S rRNA (uracil1498-N3)-methyltransferase
MRIYLSPESISNKTGITLPPDKAHHMLSVMRCKKGDQITVFDGRGRSYIAQIAGIQKKNVSIDILRETESDTEASAYLILCQGILKGDKMDAVIQDSVELGVKELVPLITERCQVRGTRRINRWRKIAEEAAEQCGRSIIPEIREPLTFGEFINKIQAKGALEGVIFWEKGGLSPDNACKQTYQDDSPFFICIGPEGGFTEFEVKSAESIGFKSATLGRRILRAGTASVVAVALIQFLIEKNKTSLKV